MVKCCFYTRVFLQERSSQYLCTQKGNNDVCLRANYCVSPDAQFWYVLQYAPCVCHLGVTLRKRVCIISEIHLFPHTSEEKNCILFFLYLLRLSRTVFPQRIVCKASFLKRQRRQRAYLCDYARNMVTSRRSRICYVSTFILNSLPNFLCPPF